MLTAKTAKVNGICVGEREGLSMTRRTGDLVGRYCPSAAYRVVEAMHYHWCMFNLILYQPEIPPNTGNAIRLSANTGCKLHLIKPFAFELDEKRVRRAGLDYREMAAVHEWESLEQCLASLGDPRWFAISTRGATRFDQPLYTSGDAFVFGPETRGLPAEVLDMCSPEQRLRIPMVPENRSLNLSNAVAVVAFEAWRQLGYVGGA